MTSPELQPGLADIIASIVGQPVREVTVRNNELPTDDMDDKQERLDVNCVTDDGRQVNLEMQASRMAELPGGQHENLKNKSVYYLCDLFSTQMRTYQWFDAVKPLVSPMQQTPSEGKPQAPPELLVSTAVLRARITVN
jgi:hypothetical protein